MDRSSSNTENVGEQLQRERGINIRPTAAKAVGKLNWPWSKVHVNWSLTLALFKALIMSVQKT